MSRSIRRAAVAAGASLVLAAPLSAVAQREAEPAGTGLGATWGGWVQADAAYTYASPAHVSKSRVRGELAGKGQLTEGVKWKLSARAGYDAVYEATSIYPAAVRRDQATELLLREAYVDFAKGDWEFRLGKQNIVWGEMVGLFFADVVSAKDYREFILPEFEQIRIPQLAARAEWFKEDTHLEFVWLPAPAIDRIGEPGSEFYSYPIRYDGLGYVIDHERKPSRSPSNGGAGVRLSTLVGGWDLAAFAYSAPDSAAAFQRSLLDGPVPTVVYQARHERVNRVGGTLAKDFDGIVAKAEVVYSAGRRFGLTTLDAGNGLTKLSTLDWVVGLEATPADGWRVNGQFYQRAFADYTPAIGLKRYENGASLLVSSAVTPSVDAEVLAITSLVRSDWLLRASVIWKTGKASRVKFGADAFGGVPYGLFGRYGNRDRVYAEYRYSF